MTEKPSIRRPSSPPEDILENVPTEQFFEIDLKTGSEEHVTLCAALLHDGFTVQSKMHKLPAWGFVHRIEATRPRSKANDVLIGRLKSALRAAECPNKCVDGIIEIYYSDFDAEGNRIGDFEPCEWCAEREVLTRKGNENDIRT